MTSKRKMSLSDKKVWQYLDHISKPQKKLGGNAICPYIKHYKDRIMVIHSTTPQQVVENFAHFKDIFHLEAVVVYGFNLTYDKQYEQIERWNKRYKKKDVFVLGMRPDSEEPPLPLNYNFTKPLIIIQKLSTLQKARHNLAKNTDYYTYQKK